MIAIIDYGMGNLRSVEKAFEKVGAKAKITDSKIDIENSNGFVLPGVGAFKDAMSRLRKLNIINLIKDNIRKGKPFLGICLGLQLLFTESEENGIHQGLDIIKGKVVRFKNKLKVPHMGWNAVSIKKKNFLLSGINNNTYFYFVHSYYVKPDDSNVIATTTSYGLNFCSMVKKDNIFATQFHPEKSQKNGLKIIENFKKLC